MKVTIPVRPGPYQYVLVTKDGSSTTVSVDPEALERGSVEVSPEEGDRIMEVALASTSDPDLEPAAGQLWPPEA